MATMPAAESEPTTATTFAAQDCRLLSLPPEIRNMIYEAVCSNLDTAQFSVAYRTQAGEDTVHPRLRTPLHPLNLACRQLRLDFKPFLSKVDPRKAHNLEWKLLDFDHQIGGGVLRRIEAQYGQDEICDYLCRLPRLDDGTTRVLTKLILLGRIFDPSWQWCATRFHCTLDQACRAMPVQDAVNVRYEFHFLQWRPLDIPGLEINIQSLQHWKGQYWALPFQKGLQEAIDKGKKKLARWKQARARVRRTRREEEKKSGKDKTAIPAVQRVMRR